MHCHAVAMFDLWFCWFDDFPLDQCVAALNVLQELELVAWQLAIMDIHAWQKHNNPYDLE
jgi:hypothetical protein